MQMFAFLIRRSQKLFLLAIGLGAVSGLCSVAFLAIINRALDRQRLSGDLAWAFLGLCLILPISRVIAHYLTLSLGQAAVQRLRVELSRKILDSPLRGMEDLGTHRLLVALTDDISAVNDALIFLPMLAVNATVVLGCLLYLGWLSPLLLGALAALMVVGIAGYQLPMRVATRNLRLAREERDGLFGFFRALTDGLKELKLHAARQREFLARLDAQADKLRRLNIHWQTFFSAATGWGQTLFFAVIGALLVLLPRLTAGDSEAVLGYVLVLLFMMTPLQVILNSLPQLSRAGVAVRKVEQLGLSLLSEGEPTTAAVAPVWRRLELRGVTHAYRGEDRDFSLGPLDLVFKPGEIVFIVGGNGSGKTTLAKVLTGLYAPQQGAIKIDGRCIDEASRESYRQLFSVVFSDFFLFDTLLGLTLPDLDQRASEYLRQLRLDRHVAVSDGALSTLALSQGQRKRLALLTAYLEDRSIYLFDEWAADQDPEFKAIFYHRLLPDLRARGKLVVVISHDDHYYGQADRLVKMNHGRIEHDGSPRPFLPTTPSSRLTAPVFAESTRAQLVR